MNKEYCRDSGVELPINKLDKRSYLLGYYDGKESKNQWISVKDSLPRDRQRCLIWDKNCNVSYDGSPETISHIYVARFFKGEIRTNHWRSCDVGFGNNQYPWNWEEGARSWFSQDVTHWMPLPSPPEPPE